MLPYESTLVKDGNNWGFRLDREFVDELEELINDDDDWVGGNVPDYWNESLSEDEDIDRLAEKIYYGFFASDVYEPELFASPRQFIQKRYSHKSSKFKNKLLNAIHKKLGSKPANKFESLNEEDFKEDLKDINPFLADLVSKSSSTLKKYLRDPKFSEEEKKQIRTELINRGFYPRGKGPNSVSFRNSRD